MDDKIYPVTADGAKKAHIDKTTYEAMYANSVADPDGFWMEQGKRIDWMKPYTKAGNWTYDYPDVSIKWFEDGTLNVSANCIDRHLPTRGDQVAIIWEGDDPNDSKSLTYRELHEAVCRFSNVLKANGAKKGDRITIYLPMIPADRRRRTGLCAYRCGAFGHIRRVFARFHLRAHSRFGFDDHYHVG